MGSVGIKTAILQTVGDIEECLAGLRHRLTSAGGGGEDKKQKKPEKKKKSS